MILFNNTAVAFDPATGPGEARRTLLTDDNVEEVGIRFDYLTLPANASFPTAPAIVTVAPARRAANAWLAPLPPGNSR